MKDHQGRGAVRGIGSRVCALILALVFPVAAGEPGEVAGLILTWQRDPSSTMTIDWHEASPLEKPVLLHRRKGTAAWKNSTPVASGFPHAPGRMVYRVELTGLEPDAGYEFRPAGRERPYHFRTMPQRLTRALRVVVGGDTAPAGTFEKINAVAASLKPDFNVPAYPSVRKDEGTTLEIRKHWVPLFEKAGISAAFEHHDHAYKRTHPLLGGKVQDAPAKGVTYLGDGAWGASIRKVRPPADVPHIAKSQSVNHVFFFEIGPKGPLRFQAIDSKGEVFDRFELPRRR